MHLTLRTVLELSNCNELFFLNYFIASTSLTRTCIKMERMEARATQNLKRGTRKCVCLFFFFFFFPPFPPPCGRRRFSACFHTQLCVFVFFWRDHKHSAGRNETNARRHGLAVGEEDAD